VSVVAWGRLRHVERAASPSSRANAASWGSAPPSIRCHSSASDPQSEDASRTTTRWMRSPPRNARGRPASAASTARRSGPLRLDTTRIERSSGRRGFWSRSASTTSGRPSRRRARRPRSTRAHMSFQGGTALRDQVVRRRLLLRVGLVEAADWLFCRHNPELRRSSSPALEHCDIGRRHIVRCHRPEPDRRAASAPDGPTNGMWNPKWGGLHQNEFFNID